MYFKSVVFTIVLFAIICVINAHPHRRHHRPRPLLPPEPYPGLPGNIPSVGYGAGGGGGGSFNAGPFRVGFGSGFGSGFGAGPNGMGSGFGAGSGYSVNGPGINLSHGQGFGAGSGSSG